jgi:hypothetical protein
MWVLQGLSGGRGRKALVSGRAQAEMKAHLDQPDNTGKFHPAGFKSRKLTQQERLQPSTCWSCLQWSTRSRASGSTSKPFDLYTDNASLLPAAATAASALEPPECVRLRVTVRVLYEMTTGIELAITCAAEYPAFCPIGIKAGGVCRELCVFCNPLPSSLSVKSALKECIDQEDVLGLNRLLVLHANLVCLYNQYRTGECAATSDVSYGTCSDCPINTYKTGVCVWIRSTL